MPGTVTVSMEVGGPVRLNISSKPSGTSDERSVAELNRLGLEHFGFDVENLEGRVGPIGVSRYQGGPSPDRDSHGLSARLHRGA